MHTTISELPTFLEGFPLSQLPFFSEHCVDDLPLPPTPPSACNECWEGLFAMHFGLPCVSPQDGKWYRRWPEEYTYVTTLAKSKSRADAGCAWCRLLVLGVLEDVCPGESEKLTITVRGTTDTWNDVEYQELEIEIKGHVELYAVVHAAPDDPAGSYVAMQSPIWDVGSPRSLALARQHIDECIHGHEHCKSLAFPSPGPQLPSRVLDCTDPARPRLFSGTGGLRGEYLALSYVWGGDQVHKTTTSNISAYEAGIALSILPSTIRDAIYITNKLGFRWLWVDSLCILQDSDEDKLHEIGRMHHIYRYAHLTIVAASANSASEGFLPGRSPPHPHRRNGPFSLPFISPPHSPTPLESREDGSVARLRVGTVSVTLRPKHHDIFFGKPYIEELGCMATRAWCMQEFLLSPRSLIFTQTSGLLLFRCRTGTHPVGDPCRTHLKHVRDPPELPYSLFLHDPPAAEPGSQEWRDAHVAWIDIVEDYSLRMASDESDKLVACAAIAEQFHCVLRCDYLAGLWRSHTLLIHLLWHANTNETDSGPIQVGYQYYARPTVYRAPSWSWAAIEGAVSFLNTRPFLGFEDPRNLALAEVVECWVTLEDAALPFGRVTDGALVLRGMPIPCRGGSAKRLYQDCWCLFWSMPLPSFEQAQCRQWGCGPSVNSDETDTVRVYSTEVGREDCVQVTLDYKADELPGTVWVVPFEHRRPQTVDSTIHGIVLEVAPSSTSSSSEFQPKRTRYRRIGYFLQRISAARRADLEHPLWGPLTRAVKGGEPPWMDIEIV